MLFLLLLIIALCIALAVNAAEREGLISGRTGWIICILAGLLLAVIV